MIGLQDVQEEQTVKIEQEDEKEVQEEAKDQTIAEPIAEIPIVTPAAEYGVPAD